MLDQSRASFTMRGARYAIAQGIRHIEAQVDAIEASVSGNPGLAFDLAKAIVESTCRTILTARGVTWAEKDDLPQLFQKTINSLQVLPPHESQEADVGQCIRRTLGGLTTAIQGISELRNRLGFASHGSDSPRPSLETAHPILAAQTADTIIGFLYHVHIQERTIESGPAPDSDFDEYVDAQHGTVSILGVVFPASEILFQIEPESYRALLAEFLNQAFASEEEA